MVKCHHCGMSHRLSTFIRMIDPSLADEYRMELYKERIQNGTYNPPERKEHIPEILKTPKIETNSVLNGLTPLNSLGQNHPAYKYAQKRAIPLDQFDKIYFAPKFNAFAKQYNDSFSKLRGDYPRLVFPYFDASNKIYALTARAFGKETPKYIFLPIEENAERIYGLWRIKNNEPIIAVEGQIDSLCLDNCIAVGGADYSSQTLISIKSNLIIVPDNDFVRNKQVADSVKKAIDLGFTVSLFPDGFRYKDVNDAVKGKYNKQQLHEMIMSNAKSGAEAKLELIFRRKC